MHLNPDPVAPSRAPALRKFGPRRALIVSASLLLLLLAPLLAGVLLLQRQPSVALHTDIQSKDVERALALLKLHDPRRLIAGQQRVIGVSAHDLELLLNHAAYRWLGGSSRVDLLQGQAQLQLSLDAGRLWPRHWPNPWLGGGLQPWGRWINVDLQLAQSTGLPRLQRICIGNLRLPAAGAESLALWALQRAGLQDQLPLVGQVIQQVNFLPQQAHVRYTRPPELKPGSITEQLAGALIPIDEQERLRVYTERIVELASVASAASVASVASAASAASMASAASVVTPASQVSLARLIGPMFELASERSTGGHDAALENRAALVVLTLYANGHGLGAVLPGAREWPRAPRLQVLLDGRNDWPKHFLISAALAAEGTGPMSRAIGLYKEIADSRGGSGFSFNDMAANRAGTRFGELAVQDPQRLQQAAAASRRESDFMPRAADLPEHMPEPEFLRRYGGVGAPAYEAQMAEIERRVAALPVLR